MERKIGNRRTLALCAVLLMLVSLIAGCGGGKSASAVSADLELRLVRDYNLGQDVEFAVVTGRDSDGNRVWNYVTENYEIGQADQVTEILQEDGVYYLCEGGTVVALELATGAVLWKNHEFGGSVPRGCMDKKGTLYLCGYWGPDYFSIDKEGNTTGRIDCFDEAFYWANNIELVGDMVAVSLENGPMERRTEKGFVFQVDPKDLSYDLVDDPS